MRLITTKQAFFAFTLLAVGSACSKKKNEPPTLTSASSPPPAVGASATMVLPPIESLVSKQTFSFGSTAMTVELCRMDASGSPVVHSEARVARGRLAAGPDGAVWMLDHERKLRRYVNRSKTGCELALDPQFGKGGVMEVDEAKTVEALAVDAGGNLYVTGDKTRKLVGGAFVESCSGFLRAQPTSKTMLLDDALWTGNGCQRTSVPFTGFDRGARAIGFLGDDILVRGFDKEGSKEVEKLGIHGKDGSQKVEVGKQKGDDALSDLVLATACGDDVCAFGGGIRDVVVSRFTRAGAFVGRAAVPLWSVRELAFTTAGADTFIYGAMQANKTTNKDAYANVVLLVRNKPAETALRGKLRGLDFFSRSVKLEHRSGSWTVEVENERRSSLSTRLVVKPLAGAISIAKPTDKISGNAFLSGEDVFEPELKKKRMSSDVAGSVREHRIEITRWDVRPYDKAKGSHQELGYASGKIFIDLPYEPNGRAPEHSVVTGDFEDAIVSSWDDPETPEK